MSTSSDVKAFEAKLDAELEKARSRIQQLAARAREKKAQAEIDSANAARQLLEKIDKQRHSLREATGKKAEEVQSDIEATRTQLNSSLEHLASKLKVEHHAPR